MRPRPNSGLRPLAFLRYYRLGAIARVEVAQLRLEIALQARTVLALERPQFLHATLSAVLRCSSWAVIDAARCSASCTACAAFALLSRSIWSARALASARCLSDWVCAFVRAACALA